MASLPCTLSHSLGATSVLTLVECRDRKGGINDPAESQTMSTLRLMRSVVLTIPAGNSSPSAAPPTRE